MDQHVPPAGLRTIEEVLKVTFMDLGVVPLPRIQLLEGVDERRPVRGNLGVHRLSSHEPRRIEILNDDVRRHWQLFERDIEAGDMTRCDLPTCDRLASDMGRA